MYPHQVERLTDVLERRGLAALVATSPANIAYIAGGRPPAPGSAGAALAVFTTRGSALVLPGPQAVAAAVDGVDVDHLVGYGPPGVRLPAGSGGEPRVRAVVGDPAASAPDGLSRALAALGVASGPIGVDERGLTPAAWDEIASALGTPGIAPASQPFLEARRVKSPYELDCLQRALGIAEEALNEVLQKLAPGMTEREALATFVAEVGRREATAGRRTVASGPRAWIPAPAVTDRALRARDLVRFDVGCVHKGYHASVARTAVVGEAAAAVTERYEVLQAAVEAAIGAIRPGAAPAGVLSVAREAAGAAHIAGHGIGLEDVESPDLDGDPAPLAMGEVLRVEACDLEVGGPGLALAETVLVTRLGSHVMNRSVRGLVVCD